MKEEKLNLYEISKGLYELSYDIIQIAKCEESDIDKTSEYFKNFLNNILTAKNSNLDRIYNIFDSFLIKLQTSGKCRCELEFY